MVKLSKWENDLLPLSLITPRDWAEQIKRRNEGLLEALEKDNKVYSGKVGCPHCIETDEMNSISGENDECDLCRWSVLRLGGCEGPKFDGLRMDDVLGVSYNPKDEELIVRGLRTEEGRGIARRFLKAHILWAERIIDGTYVEFAQHHGIKTPVCGNDMVWRKV